MAIATIIISLIIFILVGAGIGFVAFKIKNYIEKIKEKKHLQKFLKGEIDNKIQLDDGRIIDVNRFQTFDKDGNKVIIDLREKSVEKVKEEKPKGFIKELVDTAKITADIMDEKYSKKPKVRVKKESKSKSVKRKTYNTKPIGLKSKVKKKVKK